MFLPGQDKCECSQSIELAEQLAEILVVKCKRDYGLTSQRPSVDGDESFVYSPTITRSPFLSFAERRAGREAGSATAVADSAQTLLCTYLSAAVLLGLVLNSAFGWWWADAVAGLVIAAFAVREGVEAWRGDACATSIGMVLENEP